MQVLCLLSAVFAAGRVRSVVVGWTAPVVFKRSFQNNEDGSYHHRHGRFQPAATANHNGIEEFLIKQQPKGMSTIKLRQMMQRGKHLREDYVVVITGATGGIGKALCQTVLEMGGVLIVVDVSKEALMELQQQLDPDHHRIRTVVADFSDLHSVAAAGDSIVDQVSQIDILVNNAGIYYPLEDDEVEQAGVSQQGYDVCFQINYLSHFLLTEKLLTKMTPSTGRLVHVSSGLHWGVDGSRLLASNNSNPGEDPAACLGSSNRQPRHVSTSYGNSKLAQIWHAAQLNRLGAVTAVCACPSWAATGIAGSEEGREALAKFAFPTLPQSDSEVAGPGVKSILNAMFLPKDELDPDLLVGKKMIGNSKVFDSIFPRSPDEENPAILESNLIDRIFGRAEVVSNIARFLVLFFQRWSHEDLIIQGTSLESGNKQGQIALYEWSKRVVSQWLPFYSSYRQ
jgi:NAD(P)-dependent dehydrogenase (short-subunit alcohol dehydrogenase family)